MKLGKLAAMLCLIVSMWPGPCAAELLPGDIALTRIDGNVVSLMALRNIPAGEVIRFTDNNWVNGSFDATGNSGLITIGSGGLPAGNQRLIDLSSSGITLDWEDTLHFFQVVTPSHTTVSHIRHLLLVELNKDGLRWRSDIPDGLIRDVTHITIRERFAGQGMKHLIHEDLLGVSLTPYKWLRALGSFRAWQDPGDYVSPISLSQWADLQLSIAPSPGIISLPYSAQNFSQSLSKIYVPVRRGFGSTGNASVNLSAKDQIGPFKRWQNETISGLNMDLTDVAFAPGIGFVAVSPMSGTILINESGNWNPVDTNEDPGINLQLSGIIFDGSAFRACSTDGRIYKSGDGKSWSLIYTADAGGAGFHRIHRLPGAGLPFVALGSNGLAAFSADGDNWNLSEVPGSPKLFGAAFFEGRYVLCGSGGVILHTDNPGQSWVSASTPTNRDLYSVAKVDNGGSAALIVVGQYGEMLSSISLEIGFLTKPSNTSQSLFDVLEVSRAGGSEKYVIAVGANGAAVIAEKGAPFRTRRTDPRAPALYALVADPGGEEPEVYAVGEYGTLTRFLPAGFNLSGSITGVSLDGQGSALNLSWESGESGESYVKFTNSAALTEFRERIHLELERPASFGSLYRLGNELSEVNFFRSLNGNAPGVADNFGPLLNLTGTELEVLSNDEWRLSFRILNTSRRSSQRLFIRYEGTNLPDFTIPASATTFPGSRIGSLEQSALIQTTLRQPVESIALYEEFRPGEVVLKAQVAINSLVASTTWQPNGIFPRSLGAYLKDNGSLGNPGVPGVGVLGGGSNIPAPEKVAPKGQTPKSSNPPVVAYGSGFVFSGSAPTPPDNNPESSELVLLAVTVGGPVGMDVRSSYDFFLEGSFYNTGNGLSEDYTMNTVDWEVTESSSPALGLSIENDTGTFEAAAYPGVQYTRTVSIDATTTEGAPLDGEGVPVEYSDSQSLDINEPSSNRTYAEWVATTTLSGDEDGESQDPDEDGIVNLLEFVLGTDPETANAPSGTSHSVDTDRSEFTFSFTIPNDLSEVTLKIMTSDDLSTWTEQAMSLESSDSSSETWSATVTMSDKGFARLQAETYTP